MIRRACSQAVEQLKAAQLVIGSLPEERKYAQKLAETQNQIIANLTATGELSARQIENLNRLLSVKDEQLSKKTRLLPHSKNRKTIHIGRKLN